ARLVEIEQKASQAADEHLKKQLELETAKQAMQKDHQQKTLALRAELETHFLQREADLRKHVEDVERRAKSISEEHGGKRQALEKELLETREARRDAEERAALGAKSAQQLEARLAEQEQQARQAAEARQKEQVQSKSREQLLEQEYRDKELSLRQSLD